jgi:hypothetical protein
MDAEEIVARIRDNVQIFYSEPLQDGFTDDVQSREEGTSILPWADIAYTTDLVLQGVYQCWHALIMTPGKVAYRYSGKFTLTHHMYLLDTDGTTKRDLTEVKAPRQQGDPFFRNRTPGKPDAVEFLGNFLVFNKVPDAAYIAYFLADTQPNHLILRTDTPRALDEPNHMAVVAGGSHYISRMALGQPTMNEFKFRRYGEIKAEWEWRMKHCLDTATSRNLYNRSTPHMVDYRSRGQRLR